MQRIFSETTPFNEITVYETNHLLNQTGRFRCLCFADGAIQGAMDLREPQRVVLEYPRAIMHLMERNIPSFKRVFLIGHGIGTIPSRYPPHRFTVAEIDERVAEISRQFFHYRHHNIVTGDGRRLLEEQAEGAFDFVILDAFTKKGTPRHLTTYEFFKLAKSRLRTDGSLIINLNGNIRRDWRIAAIATTLADVFPQTAAFFLPETQNSPIGNLLLVGSRRSITADSHHMAGFKGCILEPGQIVYDA